MTGFWGASFADLRARRQGGTPPEPRKKGPVSLAVRRRRQSRHEEHQLQRAVVAVLGLRLDPATTFFSSLENLPRSPASAFFQRLRGVRSGLPDIVIIARGKPPIFLELKSRRGQPNPKQRAVAEELKQAGAAWYVARSVNAVMVALRREGIAFRGPWRSRRPLADWEGPFSDPGQKLPQHPRVRLEQREALWRYRERYREKKRAQRAALAGRSMTAAAEGLNLR